MTQENGRMLNEGKKHTRAHFASTRQDEDRFTLTGSPLTTAKTKTILASRAATELVLIMFNRSCGEIKKKSCGFNWNPPKYNRGRLGSFYCVSLILLLTLSTICSGHYSAEADVTGRTRS